MAFTVPAGIEAWPPMPVAVMHTSPSPAGSTAMRSAAGSDAASARTTAVAWPGMALGTVPPSSSTSLSPATCPEVKRPW